MKRSLLTTSGEEVEEGVKLVALLYYRSVLGRRSSGAGAPESGRGRSTRRPEPGREPRRLVQAREKQKGRVKVRRGRESPEERRSQLGEQREEGQRLSRARRNLVFSPFS